MNAPLKINSATRLIPAIDVLKIRAQTRAELWWEYQIELHEAVDELQAYAERAGLLAQIGQDAVQAIIAEPFARIPTTIEPKAILQVPEPEPPKRSYYTPQSTISAFWYAVGLNDENYLTQWIAEHPKDAAYLRKLWEAKCQTQSK
jgi:hypothetical protein